jgi:hypothetical protein
MYALYRKTPDGSDGHRYQFVEKTSLFGCHSGWIPELLKHSLASTANEPIKWHVSVENGLRGAEYPGCTLIIDLKPKNAGTNLSLYEVVEVWGHSSQGWTPIMLHLTGLFIDEDPNAFNRNDFTRHAADIDDPIFSMMYLKGTIRDGKLVDKWTTPGPSSTNSVLVWPDTLKYFAEEAARLMD